VCPDIALATTVLEANILGIEHEILNTGYLVCLSQAI